MIRLVADPICNGIRPGHVCVTEDLHHVMVMGLEQRLKEITDRMEAEVRRHVPNPKAPFRIGVIRPWQYFVAQRPGMLCVPGSVGFVRSAQISFPVIHKEQQVRMGFGEIRI